LKIDSGLFMRPLEENAKSRPWKSAAPRYVLLQLPGIAGVALIVVLLWQAGYLPAHYAWIVMAIWVGKEIVLFPFLYRYYNPHLQSEWFSLKGRRAIAKEPLNPEGYVQVRGEIWKAEAEGGFVNRGDPVRIVDIHGLTLRVKPEEGTSTEKTVR